MNTLAPSMDQKHAHDARQIPSKASRTSLTRTLLACGLLYSLLYAFINDVVAAELYEGYSRTSQAISELSATRAPTRALLTSTLPVFTFLLLAFGIGVWRSTQDNRALRATGALLAAHAATFPLWLLAPMTSREEMGSSVLFADIAHIVLSAVAVVFILSQIGFSAAALGKPFRRYSLSTAATVLVFGAMTGVQAPKVAAGEPTPWIGLFERISFAAWLLWVAVLAIVLLRRTRSPLSEKQSSL